MQRAIAKPVRGSETAAPIRAPRSHSDAAFDLPLISSLGSPTARSQASPQFVTGGRDLPLHGIIAVDWDGTISNPARPRFDQPGWTTELTVDAGAARTLHLLHSAGHEIHVVTNREERFFQSLYEQIRAAMLPIHPEHVHMDPDWRGYHIGAIRKARTLRSLKPLFFTDDHESGRHAAQLSQTPFIPADMFRIGHLHLPRALSNTLTMPMEA